MDAFNTRMSVRQFSQLVGLKNMPMHADLTLQTYNDVCLLGTLATAAGTATAMYVWGKPVKPLLLNELRADSTKFLWEMFDATEEGCLDLLTELKGTPIRLRVVYRGEVLCVEAYTATTAAPPATS